MLLKTIHIILSLMLTFTIAFAAYGLNDNWLHWENGLQAINEKKFNKALHEFEYYIKHPEMHRHMWGVAYFGRGLVFDKTGKVKQALGAYMMAVKNDLHPTVKVSSKSYMNMGTIFMKNNEYPEAVKVYLKAIDINPSNGLAHYFLGLTYFKSGDFENAEKQSMEAKKLGVTYSALSDKLNKVKSSSSKKTKKE